MKNKYQELNKKERKYARLEFYGTEYGQLLKIRLNRLFIYSVLLFIIGIYFIVCVFLKINSIFYMIYGVGLVITSIGFMVGRYKLLFRSVNNYLNKHKK